MGSPRDPGRKDLRRFLALFAVLAMVIAACGGDATDDTTDGGDTGGDTGGEVDLLVWASRDWYAVPDDFAAFMEANPTINVTQDVQSNDDILQQLQRMKDAGQRMPDLVNDDAFVMQAYVAGGFALPFDEYKDRWEAEHPEEYNNILPVAWEENNIDGQIWGVSLTANFDVIYYNVEHINAAGVDATTIDSLDALLDAMRAVKASDSGAIPLTVQALPGTGVTTLKTLLSAAGAPFDGAVPDLTSQGGIYTLNWFIAAANEGLLPPEAIAWGEGEARGAFLGKNAAFILDGFTVAGDFADEPDFDLGTVWGVFPAPASQTGAQKDGNQVSASRAWFISSETEHPDEAFLALREVHNTLLDQAENGGVPMRNSEMLADQRLVDLWPFFDGTLREAYEGSDSTPAGVNGGEVEGVLEQLFGEIVIGTEKSAEELAAEYQEILDGL
jgi:ABC-type glycerol-3-phosphate transport system substrate-binding protein